MENTNLHNKQILNKKQIGYHKRLSKEISPFTLNNLPLNMAEDILFSDVYCFQKVLGAGSFGVVIAAIEKIHLEHCAIKIVSKRFSNRNEWSEVSHEAKILSSLDYPNIVKCLRTQESPHHIFIAMEYLKSGSLLDFMNYHPNKHLNENECRIIMKQILEGINYIHSKNLLHRDLKLENILLKSFERLENSVKLADFGLSIEIESEPSYNPIEKCGTLWYMAPEIIQCQNYSFVNYTNT